MKKNIVKTTLIEYIVITAAVILMDIGIYVFKFPNHLSFGGVSGMAVVLNQLTGFSAAQVNLVINMILLVIGVLVLGKSFGLKTAYVTVLSSFILSAMEKVFPLYEPLTNQPILELAYAIVLPAVAAAMLFYVNASGGGTDIIAVILKKYSTMDVGIALLVVDSIIVALSFTVFDVKTGLFSVCGLVAKTIFIDKTLETMKLNKYFTIVCTEPEIICEYIKNELHRSATTFEAKGMYSGEGKTVIICALDKKQAVLLQRFIRRAEPTAFVMVTKSSEIVGKGFQLEI